MATSIIKYLGTQSLMRVIRGILSSSKPPHIRELAARYSLSPSGVSDIIRRLNTAGVLKEKRKGNRRGFLLDLSVEELACLRSFFLTFENTLLEERAARFSLNAPAKLNWMDEAYVFYRRVKRLRNDPP
jgi:DNA-binding MarR family transcriptional regulator